MDIAGETIFFGVFGLALLLAGLLAMLTGEMKLIRRSFEAQRYLRGGWATFMGLCYSVWGIMLCWNALQHYQNQHPTMWETIVHQFQWHDDTSLMILLGITFGLFVIPYWLSYITSPE